MVKVLHLLACLAGVLFFWSTWEGFLVFGFEESQYAWSVVVLTLLAFGAKACGCCGRHWKGMAAGTGNADTCSHGMTCRCGDCGRCK
ncbi:MAG: hypothetical protein A2925_05135 [Candidatus Yanofskybacteria bacterium RIFCSPLOWO2_01_FULL_44_22]|uniref:Uncharacterized protein n=1 Tax=Candidatus Yanofskybacteria bacterium RIFCSPLOWO2_01_FULL_44_22 TaxID=1802697 RepID=A0A1F8GJJ8_9BACT|nr:MAG: hypothetical protein A2659_04730 [Candidatus Yanofskybacteria bacterium RIFCSPHIGHO2_01_FULL_44_24]OGN25574.1 MAG: hypothetical protein A2925_05135 [Candidatus Yanofskybacteria bacterium RIFCSPLOWO2_01_FULL_44_22]